MSEIVDDLTYKSYAANRGYAPNVSPERWKKVYGPCVDEMEARYQAEHPRTLEAA